MKFIATYLAVLLSIPSFGADPGSLRDRALRFLANNVMGRTQVIDTQGTLTSDGVDYLVDFKATIRWGNLRRTSEGLVFDQLRVIRQTNTKLDKAGKPVGKPVRTDRSVQFHYALGERLTSNSLVGLSTMTRNSIDDPTGLGSVAMIELSADNAELYLYESQAGFSERSLDGKTFIPVATASEATLSLNKQGKLELAETLKFYKVDVNKDFAREEIHRFNLNAIEVRH